MSVQLKSSRLTKKSKIDFLHFPPTFDLSSEAVEPPLAAGQLEPPPAADQLEPPPAAGQLFVLSLRPSL